MADVATGSAELVTGRFREDDERFCFCGSGPGSRLARAIACTGVVLELVTEGGANENLHAARGRAALFAPRNRLPLV